ncbi:MAG: hypothetical protein KIS73_07945 [Enhydrobacter sp.]|nr:hypothetical protein [Enhydrobacter sp.]
MGMKARITLLIALATAAVACTRSEALQWAVVGGSKSDGNVVLGIDVPARVGFTETHVQWDESQANAEADKRCRAYGYPGAERFDKLPVQVTCHAQGISPCWSKTYRLNYQCNDKR